MVIAKGARVEARLGAGHEIAGVEHAVSGAIGSGLRAGGALAGVAVAEVAVTGAVEVVAAGHGALPLSWDEIGHGSFRFVWGKIRDEEKND